MGADVRQHARLEPAPADVRHPDPATGADESDRSAICDVDSEDGVGDRRHRSIGGVSGVIARLFVDDRNAAEDLVQEAFIRLARSAHRIHDPARAPAYLRSIVLNLARDHLQRGGAIAGTQVELEYLGERYYAVVARTFADYFTGVEQSSARENYAIPSSTRFASGEIQARFLHDARPNTGFFTRVTTRLKCR